MSTRNSSSEHSAIVLIPDLETGGAERVVRELIGQLSEMGIRIRLVSDAPPALREKAGIATYRYLNWRRPFHRIFVIASELWKCERNTPVIAVLTGPLILCGLINFPLGRRVIGYEHSDLEQLYFRCGAPRRMLRKTLLKIALCSLVRLIVVTQYLKMRAPPLLSCSPKKIAYVPNPVQPFLRKIEADLSFDRDGLLDAYIIGRNAPEKRHLQALELLAASARVGRIFLVVADASGLLENVSHKALTKLQVLPSYAAIRSFSRSSFLFSYSAVESYSLVTAEWLSSDLPVITVSTEPMKLLWGDKRRCAFVPVNAQVSDVEAAIDIAFSSVDLREAMEPIPAELTAKLLVEVAYGA
jgi:glycosyltransferase involved in cell wall biosynthesis